MSHLAVNNDRDRSNSIQSLVSSIFSSNNNSSFYVDDDFSTTSTCSSSPSPSPVPTKQQKQQKQDSGSETLTPQNTHLLDTKLQFLQCIDPMPTQPPNYLDVNPSKNRISFPIWEIQDDSLTPPDYTPTVEGYTIISMRTEFDTPSCKLPQFKSKIWQNFILEINSTQINLYKIDSNLTRHIPNYNPGTIPSNILSSFQRKQCHQFDMHDHQMIMDLINSDKHKYLSHHNLIHSFSLQFAKCGLPLDYLYRQFFNKLTPEQKLQYKEFEFNKLPHEKIILNLIPSMDHNCLRVRLEDKQFLWRFLNVETMLHWYGMINTGMNVALDLDLREFPDYRIIPRRRSSQYRDFYNISAPEYLNSEEEEEEEDSEENTIESISQDENEHDEGKYDPYHKPTSYERFLNESIRCIKPFNESKSWNNKILVIQAKEPQFQTINLPEYYRGELLDISQFKTKNHYLKLVLMNDNNVFVNLDHSVVMNWNDLNCTRII